MPIVDTLQETKDMNAREQAHEGALPLPCPPITTLKDVRVEDAPWLEPLLIPFLSGVSRRLLHRQKRIYGLLQTDGRGQAICAYRVMIKLRPSTAQLSPSRFQLSPSKKWAKPEIP
jgi:hypothetical protein